MVIWWSGGTNRTNLISEAKVYYIVTVYSFERSTTNTILSSLVNPTKRSFWWCSPYWLNFIDRRLMGDINWIDCSTAAPSKFSDSRLISLFAGCFSNIFKRILQFLGTIPWHIFTLEYGLVGNPRNRTYNFGLSYLKIYLSPLLMLLWMTFENYILKKLLNSDQNDSRIVYLYQHGD